jgi:uroporphyrin-III C-methyltransferase/precorrin-2 dehydrogenase/sirohydrochlorin ferrochelatase
MDYFPIFLRLAGEPVLVVGGGAVAARKIDLLLRASAKVTVVAPVLTAALARQVEAGALVHIDTEFQPEYLRHMRLAIAATDRPSVNSWVARQARLHNIPVNVVDDRELSGFIMPAIVDRSPVIVAVGSSGDAPVLTRRLREKLESFLPQRLGALARLAGRLRPLVKARVTSARERRKFWEQFFDGPFGADVLAGRENADSPALERRIGESLSNLPRPLRMEGEVALVGAGPGDPGLLTLRALRALQNADVVLYDRLVSAEVLDLARRDADRIFVGKAAGEACISQEQINHLLVELAQQGKRVCRLKGGDPFIFGRGGEELQTLAAHGIRFEVVPGITAAAGCAAYAGIPLTHRDHAQALTFVTGHVKDGPGGNGSEDDRVSGIDSDVAADKAPDVAPDNALEMTSDTAKDMDWAAMARPGQTCVFYMGLAQLENIIARLREQGAPARRPAAVVQDGTRPTQRVVTGTLEDLAAKVRQAGMRSPAILIVGEAVGLQQTLHWFNAPRTAVNDVFAAVGITEGRLTA